MTTTAQAAGHGRSVTGELTVGELARRVGTTRSAVRFYEAHGLTTSRRTDGNHRRYRPDTVARLRVVRAERSLGTSLPAIASLLSALPDAVAPTARDWDRFLTGWRTDLDRRRDRLDEIRRECAAACAPAADVWVTG